MLVSFVAEHLWVLFPDVFMVLTSEVAVDAVKHAFITKFNDITADVRTDFFFLGSPSSYVRHVLCQVYSEYRASLAFDLVSSRQKNVSDSFF